MPLRPFTTTKSANLILIGAIVVLVTMMFITETISARTDKSPQHTYQFEWVSGYHTDSTNNLIIGDHKYYDGTLFAPGDGPSGTPIGMQRSFDFASNPPGTSGGIEWGSYEIDDVGNIFIAQVFGPGVDNEIAIVGGTGAFRSASGYAISERIGSGHRLFTFYFDHPIDTRN